MNETLEGRSRLVSLAYKVLNRIDFVAADMTDAQLSAALAAEFHKLAAEASQAEFNQRRQRGKLAELPTALATSSVVVIAVACSPSPACAAYAGRTARLDGAS